MSSSLTDRKTEAQGVKCLIPKVAQGLLQIYRPLALYGLQKCRPHCRLPLSPRTRGSEK